MCMPHITAQFGETWESKQRLLFKAHLNFVDHETVDSTRLGVVTRGDGPQSPLLQAAVYVKDDLCGAAWTRHTSKPGRCRSG